MASDPFKFNSNAKYEPGQLPKWPYKFEDNPSKIKIQVRYNDHNGGFEARFPDIFEKYDKLSIIRTKDLANAWKTNPMQFWQNQLNFAIWCATTGCGVSYEDHLNAKDDFVRSFYRFHMYYQARRILADMKAKQPQDEGWNATNNSYSRRDYENICNEFGAPHNISWGIQHVSISKGVDGGDPTSYYSNIAQYQEASMYVERGKPPQMINFDEAAIKLAAKGWNMFIIIKSKGFTKAGVARINDSIRTYVWAILSAQVQARAKIIGESKSFDAQKQFMVIVENSISDQVDIPTSIYHYQRDLGKASSVVNFSFGVGLYMAPSDMVLRIGKHRGYNNLIMIASDDQPLGLHNGINKEEVPTNAENETGEEGIVKPDPESSPAATRKHFAPRHPMAPHYVPQIPRIRNTDHEDEKIALVVAGVAASLVAFWFLH